MLLHLDLAKPHGKPTRERPYTIAILALDWEDKLGLGMECPRTTRTFYALETGLAGWAQRNPGTFVAIEGKKPDIASLCLAYALPPRSLRAC